MMISNPFAMSTFDVNFELWNKRSKTALLMTSGIATLAHIMLILVYATFVSQVPTVAGKVILGLNILNSVGYILAVSAAVSSTISSYSNLTRLLLTIGLRMFAKFLTHQ
jgi:hypothetical protein